MELLLLAVYVTGPEKTGHIYTKHTCSYYDPYVIPILYELYQICKFYWIPYGILHNEMSVTILSNTKKLLHFKVSKLGQILCVDNTGFLKPGHIFCVH